MGVMGQSALVFGLGGLVFVFGLILFPLTPISSPYRAFVSIVMPIGLATVLAEGFIWLKEKEDRSEN